MTTATQVRARVGCLERHVDCWWFFFLFVCLFFPLGPIIGSHGVVCLFVCSFILWTLIFPLAHSCFAHSLRDLHQQGWARVSGHGAGHDPCRLLPVRPLQQATVRFVPSRDCD